MPELRTDDAVRRLRGVWLGPDRYRLPVDWTYVEWGGFLAAEVILVPAIGFAVWAAIGDTIASATAGLLFGSLASWYVRAGLTKLIDPERPARYWWRLATRELSLGTEHTTRHRWRAPVGVVAVIIVSRVAAAISGRSILVWLALLSVPVWLIVTALMDRRAERRIEHDDLVEVSLSVPPVAPIEGPDEQEDKPNEGAGLVLVEVR